jgi:hypothetical protein
MQVEDMLVGSSNWPPWKTRLIFFLEDLELWDIVQAHVVAPPATAPILVEEFMKRNKKEKITTCDSVRDHIIPHLIGKDFSFEMWDSLCNIYQSSNQNQKMVLFERLRSIQMLNIESVTYYLERFT